MKHLYIIGNGFDIFTGLKTRYVDFQHWLENNYPFIYENMVAAYDINGEWWNDFEVQLGKLNVKQYVKKFLPPQKPFEQILKENAEKRAFEEKYKLPPSLRGSHCASRLRGLLDILQYCFEKWVNHCQKTLYNTKYVKLIKEDSYFINFNYTDVLQWLYKIPEDNVLHIHGRASHHERLIFGHNVLFLHGDSNDEEETCFELSRYNKNPFQYIYSNPSLIDVAKDVEVVHIYGFSFSPVDIDYVDWIYKHVPRTSQWEVSWFSEEDIRRIDTFVEEYRDLKGRLIRMQLSDIEI